MKKQILSLFAATAVLASCSDLKNPETKSGPEDATADTAVVYRNGQTAGAMADTALTAVENAWDLTRAKLADTKLEEIDLPEVSVRGDDTYNVYGLEEKVLFDTDKAEIKSSATRALSEISSSIGRRYQGKDVRVLGFADSRGDKDYNKDLSAKRAAAVQNWLVNNGKIAAERVTLEPMGEEAPIASNATAAGRQQNRRVEIAVRK